MFQPVVSSESKNICIQKQFQKFWILCVQKHHVLSVIYKQLSAESEIVAYFVIKTKNVRIKLFVSTSELIVILS